MKLLFLFLPFLTFVARAQFQNIMLAEEQQEGRPMVEPSIVINPKDPNNIIAAYSLDRIKYTKDGGASWEEVKVTSPYGVYGDVVLEADPKGDVYFFHLSDPSGEGRSNDAWLDRIVCHRSEDGGKTWDEGRSIGHNPPKDQDKPWVAVHPKKGNVVVTWTQFDKYGLSDPACQSNILFSISTNGGKKWSEPVQLNQNPGDCIDSDNTTEGAVPAISSDGRIFVMWSNAGTLYLDRSYDDGNMWLRNDLPVAEQEGGWDMEIPGLGRCNGMPVLKIDNSTSKFRNALYAIWADQGNGEDDTDIWFMRSTNFGDNWSAPSRINKEETKSHQFLPWMSIDQTSGYIYVVYYDRRAYSDNQTDVYLAYSTDGGYHFEEVKISETPFTPSEEKFFGDYTNISAHNGVIVPIWTRMDNGKTSVMTAIIKEEDLTKKKRESSSKKKK